MNEVTIHERRAVARRIIEKAVEYMDVHAMEFDGWSITDLTEIVDQELTFRDMVDCFGPDRWCGIYTVDQQCAVGEVVNNAVKFAVTLYNSMSEPAIHLVDDHIPSVCRKVFEYALDELNREV